MSDPAAQPALLELERCTIRFGGLTAVSALDLRVGASELVGLIGPNGAGKTTVFNLTTGVYQPTEGSISFNNQSLLNLKPYQITWRGVARTFQNVRLFPSMTVFDNVRVAFRPHLKGGLVQSLWRGQAFFQEEEAIGKNVLEILEIFHLARSGNSMAKNL